MEKSLQQKLQEELNCAGFEHTLFRYEKMLKEFNSFMVLTIEHVYLMLN